MFLLENIKNILNFDMNNICDDNLRACE